VRWATFNELNGGAEFCSNLVLRVAVCCCWAMAWCLGDGPKPSRWLAPGLERARAQRTRPCELARGARGALSIPTDSARRRVLLLRGWRARIGCLGRTASFGTGFSPPPRWPGLVEWRRRCWAGCWSMGGAVHGGPPSRLVGRGGDDVPSGDIVLG